MVDCFEEQRDYIPIRISKAELAALDGSAPTTPRTVTIEPPTSDEQSSDEHTSEEPARVVPSPRPSNFLGALHEELLDFAARLTPSIKEIRQRAEVVDRVRAAAKSVYPNCSIKLFGSTLTGLALPTSDIDLVCFNWGEMEIVAKRTGLMEKFAQALCDAGVSEEEDIEIIATARVPIVKFKDPVSGFCCDCCFDRQGGIDGAKLVKRMRKKYGAFLPICIFLKYYHGTRNVNEVFSGGVGSFSLCCMIVSMFQADETRSNRNISRRLFTDCGAGSWLMEFFRLYGLEFNYSKVAISVAFQEGLQSKKGNLLKPNQPYLLSIINPYERDTDAARNSYLIMWARKAYQTSYKDLLAYANSYPNPPSLREDKKLDPNFPILGQLLPPDCLESVLSRPVPTSGKPPFNFLSNKSGVIKNGVKKRKRNPSSADRNGMKKRRVVCRNKVNPQGIPPTTTTGSKNLPHIEKRNKRKVSKKNKLTNHIRKVVRK